MISMTLVGVQIMKISNFNAHYIYATTCFASIILFIHLELLFELHAFSIFIFL